MESNTRVTWLGLAGLALVVALFPYLFYIENWSVSLDITLIFRTIPAVLFARGVY